MTEHYVKFCNKPSQRAQCLRIARRFIAGQIAYGIEPDDLLDVEMTVSAVAAQGQVPLDLTVLEQFDDFNFNHDVAGMLNHIDRSTGLLTRCFLPRAARPQYKEAAQ